MTTEDQRRIELWKRVGSIEAALLNLRQDIAKLQAKPKELELDPLARQKLKILLRTVDDWKAQFAKAIGPAIDAGTTRPLKRYKVKVQRTGPELPKA